MDCQGYIRVFSYRTPAVCLRARLSLPGFLMAHLNSYTNALADFTFPL